MRARILYVDSSKDDSRMELPTLASTGASSIPFLTLAVVTGVYKMFAVINNRNKNNTIFISNKSTETNLQAQCCHQRTSILL